MQGLSFCLQPHSPLQFPNYILPLPAVQDTFAVLTYRAHWKENSLEPNRPGSILKAATLLLVLGLSFLICKMVCVLGEDMLRTKCNHCLGGKKCLLLLLLAQVSEPDLCTLLPGGGKLMPNLMYFRKSDMKRKEK